MQPRPSLRVVICLLLLSVAWPHAQAPPASDVTGRIMTVTGPIDPKQIGHTLMHEHLFIDFTVPDDDPARWRLAGRTKPVGATAVSTYNAPLTLDILGAVILGAPNRDNWRLDDERVAVAEVAAFKRSGGATIVDVTSTGLKRNPEGLVRVSRSSGVNVVMGSSWYAEAWHPADLDRRSIDSLTAEIIRDLTVGVGDTNIRAGIIGEVGATGHPSALNESKVIRASARASRMTGAAITLHSPGRLRQQAQVLDMLAAEGADLSRVIVGHSDPLANDLPRLTSLLERGVTIQFDLFGRPTVLSRTRPSDLDVARAIVNLINAGFGDRVVISQDICTKTSLKAYGGTGYDFIETTLLPYLKREGITDAQIEAMMVGNPQRLLTFVAPQLPKVAGSSGQ